MTQLLVSVRSAMEAEAALRGGADLIDVKEPAQGSLGRASDHVIAEVVSEVAGRRPVSAALGELFDDAENGWPPDDMRLSFVKWGLAGQADRGAAAWHRKLRLALRELAKRQPNCRAVAVAYADWQRAQAPRPEEVCSFAVESGMGAFLIDTWQKDGSTLLDWLSLPEVENLQHRCRSAGVPVALAGSLGQAQILTLLPLRPDWIAVRGAVCQGRQRSGIVDEDRVRQLAVLIGTTSPQQEQGL